MTPAISEAMVEARKPASLEPGDVLDFISDNLSIESWVEGKTLTVMFDGDDGERRFAKLRLVRVADHPSSADLRGEPE